MRTRISSAAREMVVARAAPTVPICGNPISPKISTAFSPNILMRSSGTASAAKKNTTEMSRALFNAAARIFSTERKSPFPQYCAARTVDPMVSAA